jgi:ABC-type uncharacterized transport system auxiliary subunit
MRLSISMLPLLLASCFGSAPIEEHFYSLHGPRGVTEKGNGPRLLVSEFTAAPGYDSQRLAYRVSNHELRYYAHRQWVSEPPRMLSEALIRHLRASGRFSQVARGDKLREPDAILDGIVDAVEQVDRDDGWQARLALTFYLRRGDSERIVLRHAFDVTMPCAKRRPEEVARTISEIFEREAERLGRRISGALGR